jgi:hypothetical protein
MQEDLEQADDARLMDLEAGIADGPTVIGRARRSHAN